MQTKNKRKRSVPPNKGQTSGEDCPLCFFEQKISLLPTGGCGITEQFEMYEGSFTFCREFIFLEKSESTNNDIKLKIRQSAAPLFAVISAKEQSGGRGRLGRSFFSPSGGLYFSASFPLSGEEKNIPFLTLLSGLAVSLAIEQLTGVKTLIKWPNDIYYNDKKLGGILCELVSGKTLTAVVGIGINLSIKKEDIPEELTSVMTSFCAEGLCPPDSYEFIRRITDILDALIYEQKQLFSVSPEIIEAIRSRSYSIGKKVKYETKDGVISGTVTNININGAAEITLPDGTKREIFCGEII